MLVFMVGGDDDAVARVRPVLDPLGRATFHIGELGLGNTMKLVNSLAVLTTTWVSLEGLSPAAKSGIEVQRAVEILRTNGVANFYLDRMVETIDERDCPTQFALGLAAKDAGLIVDRGRALGARRRRARRCCRCWWGRSPPASASATGAISSPWPSARATSSSAGPPTPRSRPRSVGVAEHVGGDAQRGDGCGTPAHNSPPA